MAFQPMKVTFWLSDVRSDLTHGAYLLARDPVFALTATLSLAIGIGANAAIFTVVDALLWRAPVGVEEPSRLVEIGQTLNGAGFHPMSYARYVDIGARTTTLERTYAFSRGSTSVVFEQGDAGAERIFAKFVSNGFFVALGTRTALGRVFGAGDSDSSPIVLLSHRFWSQRFNRDSNVLGRTIRVNGRLVTVVGVAAEGFHGTELRRADVWLPLGMAASAQSLLTNPDAGWLFVGGRMRASVTPQQVAAEFDVVGRAGESQATPSAHRERFRVLPASSSSGGATIPTFLILLLGLLCAVLAIACVNVAGVLVARAAARQREMAIRLAIGASRSRLVRQLLTETLLIFAIGAAAGIFAARVMTSALVAQLPELPFPLELNLALNWHVVLYAVAVSCAASLLSGLAPALYATKREAMGVLTAGFADQRKMGLRRTLVAMQVVLSVVLVIVGVLFTRSLGQAQALDPGFNPRGVELVSLDLSSGGHTDGTGRGIARELLERVRRLPVVDATTVAASAPGGFEGVMFGALSEIGAAREAFVYGDWNVVESAYFSTMRIPVLAGRDFGDTDREGMQPVAILSASAVKRLWPETTPREVIGRRIARHPFGPSTTASQVIPTEIIGVVGDVKAASVVDGASQLQIYLPLQQVYHPRLLLAVRTRDGSNINSQIRAIVGSVAKNVPILREESAEAYASLGLTAQRAAAYVAGSLGLFGLVLATIGIYGVTAHAVVRRTREIGIRTALGAQRGDIVRMIAAEGLTVVAVGIAIGLLVSTLASRALKTYLVGVIPTDPVTFVGVAVLFAVITLAACLVPSYAATRIRPTEALRVE